MEDKRYEEDLDVEIVEDDVEEFEDEDVEEYEFNDEDDEADDASEGDEEDTKEPDASEDDKSEGLKNDKEFELKLLNDLGYKGSYEEARAAYEAEKSKAEGEVDGPAVQQTDYNELAKKMLDEINTEYGLELKDYSQFEDIEKFAELSLDDSYGAVKAFAATNHKLVIEGARNKAKQELLGKLKPPSKDHLKGLPKAEGSAATSEQTRVSKREYDEIKSFYPNMSKSEILKVARRVQKNTKK